METHAWRHAAGSAAFSGSSCRDCKTVSEYLAAEETRRAGQRPASCVEPWRSGFEARCVDDGHLEASVLQFANCARPGSIGRHDPGAGAAQVGAAAGVLGAAARGSAVTVEIDHPAGEEIAVATGSSSAARGGRAGVRVAGALPARTVPGRAGEQMTFGHLAGASTRCWSQWAGRGGRGVTDRTATFDDTRYRPVDEGRRADAKQTQVHVAAVRHVARIARAWSRRRSSI